MIKLPRFLAIVLCAGLSGALAACGKGDEPGLGIALIGDAGSLVTNGLRLSGAGQVVRAATAEGLVAFDEQGRVVPALADRWIVTDDGLSYIFRLRDGNWANGTPLTGESGRDALREALAGLKGTPLGLDLADVVEVRAMAGRVIEVRLENPLPDLLDLLAQPELALLGKGRETGPLHARMKDDALVLTPVQPRERGLEEPEDWAANARAIRLWVLPARTATARFSAKEVAAVFGGTTSDYAAAVSVLGLSRSALRVDAVIGLFGLLAVGTDGPMAAPEMREALAMAIDRDAIAAALAIPDWAPTSRVIPPGIVDAPQAIGERWVGMDMAHRRLEARSRLSKVSGGRPGARELRIALPVGQDADVLFARLAADFAAVGLVAKRVGPSMPADLRLIDSVARYPRSGWFLNQFACAAGRNPCSLAADAKALAARRQANPAVRAGLLEDAETALTLANVYIPLGTPVRWSLVRGDLPGFAQNQRGWHPLAEITMPPK